MPTVQAKFMYLEGDVKGTATYLLIDYTDEDDLNSKISTLESEQKLEHLENKEQ
tara:strand:+ start:344 stop:505 length:162 start_codon:yes stop_codon:yes gene_type:complete